MKLNFNRFLIRSSDHLNAFLEKFANFQRLFEVSSKDFFFKGSANLTLVMDTVDDFLVFADHLEVHTYWWVKILMKILHREYFVFYEFLERDSLVFFVFEHFLEYFVDFFIGYTIFNDWINLGLLLIENCQLSVTVESKPYFSKTPY